MAVLSEAQRIWVEDFLAITGAGAIGEATGGLAAALFEESPALGAELDASSLSETADLVGFISGQVSAPSAAPATVVKVRRIEPVEPEDLRMIYVEPPPDVFWVEFDDYASDPPIKHPAALMDTTVHEMVNSPDYVDNQIVNVEATLDPKIPWTERPQIMELKLTYKGGTSLPVPRKAIRLDSRDQAKHFRRNKKLIYPVNERGNALYDKQNTPNIVLCAEYMEYELQRRLDQMLEVVSIGAEFGKIFRSYSGAGGRPPSGHPPVGSRSPYRPNFQGPQRGGSRGSTAGRSGKPTTDSGSSRGSSPTSPTSGSGAKSGQGTTSKPMGGVGDKLPPVSMRLPEQKGPARGGSGARTPVKSANAKGKGDDGDRGRTAGKRGNRNKKDKTTAGDRKAAKETSNSKGSDEGVKGDPKSTGNVKPSDGAADGPETGKGTSSTGAGNQTGQTSGSDKPSGAGQGASGPGGQGRSGGPGAGGPGSRRPGESVDDFVKRNNIQTQRDPRRPGQVTAQPKQDSKKVGQQAKRGGGAGRDPVVVDPNIKSDQLRGTPGRVSGGDKLPVVNGNWFGVELRPGQYGPSLPARIAPIPGQIVRAMRNIGEFKNFAEFRQTFWRLVAQDSRLAPPGGWAASNMALMRNGKPPRVISSQATGGRSNAVLQLNHRHALEHGGDVYNFDNLEVVTPAMHGDMRM